MGLWSGICRKIWPKYWTSHFTISNRVVFTEHQPCGGKSPTQFQIDPEKMHLKILTWLSWVWFQSIEWLKSDSTEIDKFVCMLEGNIKCGSKFYPYKMHDVDHPKKRKYKF